MTDEQLVDYWNANLGGPARLDFAPCYDDRPFVADMTVGIPRQFSGFLLVAVLAVAALTAAMLVSLPRQEAGLPGHRRLAGAALYFCLLGTGFMLVEVVLAQRLTLYLGYPVLTLSVILFSLLLGGGLGSLWSQTWPASRGIETRAAIAAGLVAVGALVVHGVHPVIVSQTLAWDIQYRCAMAMALLLPLGFAMGIPFPTGVRVVGQWSQDLVPWMWGLNGVTSVVGSVATMVLAKLHGFGACLILGALIYALAGCIALIHGRSRPSASLPE